MMVLRDPREFLGFRAHFLGEGQQPFDRELIQRRGCKALGARRLVTEMLDIGHLVVLSR